MRNGQDPLMQTILVVAANRFFRESLLRLFRTDKTLRVLGAAESSASVGRQVLRLQPEIIVLSPESGEATFSVTCALHDVGWESKILLIGMRDDREAFLQAVRAGAVGYLLRDASPRQILSALHRLRRNSVVCPPHLLWELFRRLGSGSGLASPCAQLDGLLTPREHQLAALVAQGLANKEIAERLNLSLGTVKSHVHSILQKTQSKNRAELTGMIELAPPPSEAVN